MQRGQAVIQRDLAPAEILALKPTLQLAPGNTLLLSTRWD
jgi:hypothetical protein